MSEPSEHVKSLFVQALALDPAGRAALLAPLPPEVLSEVEGLLAAHDRAGDFLGGPAEPPPATEAWVESPAPPAGGVAEAPGRLLAGRYKLLEAVGEGGMGAVWMAQQVEPVRRLVAVKLIKAGMDGGQVLARFEAERQALALMDHPNIAKVLDAGTDEGGRPFFVMELVKGVPITEFCDARRLTPRQRLELFVPVCRAVQHAHQKGIIHRDIKPSNVLVGLYDDKPVPKVIDFGIAKATGEPLTDKTLHTGLAAVVGTPAYMAPEQATLNNLDVDTRADVYGLGALLYELLAGSPPFVGAELRKAGLLEMLRVMREEEPPRPSMRVSTAAGKPGIAAARGTDPGALAGLLRSDLDWVVMKALDKDRGRRYETAAGFAADVERFLAGEAVNAAPPSRLYRLRKFTGRNRRAVVLGGSLALAAVGGVGGFVRSEVIRAESARREADAERAAADKARRLTGLLQRLLESADPNAAGGPEGTVGRMLDWHAPALWAELADQPEAEASVRLTVGRAYSGLIESVKAEEHLRRAANLRRAADPDDPRLAEALTDLALVLNEVPLGQDFTPEERTARLAQGVAAAQEAVEILRRHGRPPSEVLAHALVALAAVRYTQAQATGKEFGWFPAAVRDAMEVARPLPGDGPKRALARCHEFLSGHERLFGRLASSTRHAEQALALRREVAGDDHLTTARARLVIGGCFAAARDWPRAEGHYRAALAGFAKLFGGRPDPYSVETVHELLIGMAGQYRDEAAEAELKARPPSWEAPDFRFPEGNRLALQWGWACLRRGDFAAAEALFRRAIAARTAVAGPFTSLRTRDHAVLLATALVSQGRAGEARAILQEYLPAARRLVADADADADAEPHPFGGASPYMLPSQLLTVAALADPGDGPAALAVIGRWQAGLANRTPFEGQLATFMELAVRHRLGQYDKVVAGEPALPAGWLRLSDSDRLMLERILVDSLERLGDTDAAERRVRQFAADCEGRLGKDDPQVATRLTLLADFLRRKGRTADAAGHYKAAYGLLAVHPAAGGKSLTNRLADLAGRLADLPPATPAEAASWRAERAKYPPGPPAAWGAESILWVQPPAPKP